MLEGSCVRVTNYLLKKNFLRYAICLRYATNNSSSVKMLSDERDYNDVIFKMFRSMDLNQED